MVPVDQVVDCGNGDITLIITGGLRTPADFAKAMALGADAVSIGTAALIALGDNDPRWELEVADFIHAIQHDSPITTGTSQDALAAMKLVFAIYDGDGK